MTVTAVSCPLGLGSSTTVSFGPAQPATSTATTTAIQRASLVIDGHHEFGAAHAQDSRRRAHRHRLRRLLGDAARGHGKRAALQAGVEAAVAGRGVELEALQA